MLPTWDSCSLSLSLSHKLALAPLCMVSAKGVGEAAGCARAGHGLRFCLARRLGRSLACRCGACTGQERLTLVPQRCASYAELVIVWRVYVW